MLPSGNEKLSLILIKKFKPNKYSGINFQERWHSAFAAKHKKIDAIKIEITNLLRIYFGLSTLPNIEKI